MTLLREAGGAVPLGLPPAMVLKVAAGALVGWGLSQVLWLFLMSHDGIRYLFEE